MTALPYQAPRFRRRSAAVALDPPEISSEPLTTEDVQPTQEGLAVLFSDAPESDQYDGSFAQLVEQGWESDCADFPLCSDLFGNDLDVSEVSDEGSWKNLETDAAANAVDAPGPGDFCL